MAQLMPLPLTVSCFNKTQIGFTFLVPAHPDTPGKGAVKFWPVANFDQRQIVIADVSDHFTCRQSALAATLAALSVASPVLSYDARHRKSVLTTASLEIETLMRNETLLVQSTVFIPLMQWSFLGGTRGNGVRIVIMGQ